MDLLSSSRSSSTKKINKNIDENNENNINNMNLNKYYSETGPDTGLGGGGGTKGMESYEHAGSEHSYQSQVKFNFIYFV